MHVSGNSGAGKTFERWPEILDNIVPYIGGEEEKSEKEPLKVWGKIENGQIVSADSPLITTQCLRVPVSDGHTAAVFVSFEQKPSKEEILKIWEDFKGVRRIWSCLLHRSSSSTISRKTIVRRLSWIGILRAVWQCLLAV